MSTGSIPEVAPKDKVIHALENLGYHLVRQGTHISMSCYTSRGIQIPLTIPDVPEFKASALRMIISRAGITKQDFLEAYNHQ